MAFRDSLKKYREAQSSQTTTSSASSTTTSGTSNQSTSGSAGGGSGNSFRDYLKKYRESQATGSVQGWIETSINLVNDVQNRSQNWFDNSEYLSQYDRITAQLATADAWRKKYAGNDEAISYIDSVVDALTKAKNYSFSNYNYYSQWENEDKYFKSSNDTRKDRQQRYNDNLKRIAELEAERKNSDDPFIRLGIGDRAGEINAEIAKLRSENRKYERGEDGWASKTMDDYYGHTEAKDFEIAAENRNFTNPTRDDLIMYDSLNDGDTWYFDANGVYRDAYGNELIQENGVWVNPAAKDEKYKITDRLGMYLSATDAEISEAVGMTDSTEGSWAKVLADGEYYHWGNLTEQETGIYYYLLNTQGTAAADKFLDDMEVELAKRETNENVQKWAKAYDDADALGKIFLNAVSVPANVFGGAAGFIDDAGHTLLGEEVNPYNIAHGGMHYTNTVRGMTATELDETGFEIPGLDFSLGDIYQVGMSRLDSALATGIGGGAGTFLLGMGSATNEAYRLYQAGASSEQITWGALTAGAAEVVFEYASFDKLVKMKDAKTVGQWVKNALIQGGIEASEEGFTEIANTITNAIIMGSESDLAKLYEENGGDEWKTFLGLVQQTSQAAFGGFLGGFGAGATQGGKTYINAQAQYNQAGKTIMGADGGVDALKALANEVAGVTSGRIQNSLIKQAGKVSSDTATGKGMGKVVAAAKNSSNATKVGRLYDTVQTANNLANASMNQADIAKSLERKGFNSETANDIAKALVARHNGQTLTKAQSKLLESADKSKVVQEAISNIIENEQSTMGQRSQNIRDFSKDVALGRLAKAAGVSVDTVKKMAEGNLTAVAENGSESRYEVSADGNMVNTKTGDVIEPQGLVQAEDGTYKIAVKDADSVSPGEVSYADNNQALVYETFVNLEKHSGKISKVIADMNLASRNELIGLYNPKINKDGGTFVNGILNAYFYGHRGIDMATASKDSPMFSLTPEQRAIAWNTGKAAGIQSTNAAQSNVDTVYAEAKNILESGKAKKGSYHAVLEDGISPMQLNKAQKAVYRLADDIAQGVQTNIRVYAGKDKAQGFYNHATDEIWLNLNAANTGREAIMAFTLAHELMHRAKKGSPAKYQAFVDFLMKEYGKQGSDVEAMIAEQIQAAEEFNKTVPEKDKVNMTREKALEEVVCDACQRMLLDTNAGQKLAEFGAQRKQNKSFLADLKQWITELLDKLRSYFKNAEPDSLAAKEFAKFDANVKQILADMYVDMSMEAGEKLSTIKAAYGGEFAQKFLGLKDISYNLAAVDTHKTNLQKGYSEESSTDLDTIMKRYDKIIDIWIRLGGELNSEFLADWNSKVKNDRTFTIFKAQAGYKYNVELSSMCKKGVPLFEAIDTIVKKEVMKELEIDVLGKAEKEILYDILKQHHFEIPCAICYVEQARQREGVIIDAFLNGKVETNAKGETTKVKLGWNQVLESIEKEMKANGVNYSFAQVSREIATEKYTPANLSMDSKTQVAFYAALKKIANQEIARYNKAESKNRQWLSEMTKDAVDKVLGGTLPANLKIFKVLFHEPGSRFKIQNDLLYSSVATQNLSMAHNKLYGLFNSQGGVSGYKTKQGTTIYWGDILGKTWRPDTLRNEGGVRNQSNSDFQMYTLLDQAQMYLDFTAKGYYLQAYTKVLSELKLFGLSRGKINASLIPKVVVYRNADGSVDIEKTMATAGLDENGNPIYDDIEGINHDEAFMLIEDPEYSKSICGICIGYSDAHINKLLDDNRVQQIIGFHDKTDDGSKRYKGARYAKNYNGLNEAVNKDGKTVHIGFNPYVKRAEKKFQFNAETETFEGTVKYNGKTYTADDIPRLATDLYLEMCAKKEYTPAYKDFSGHPNYYKLLADFGLYDSQGHYAPHRKVVYNMPDTVPYLDANGKKQTMSTYDYIKAELVKELAVRDSISEALADTSSEGIIPQFKAEVKKRLSEKSYSLAKGEDQSSEESKNTLDNFTLGDENGVNQNSTRGDKSDNRGVREGTAETGFAGRGDSENIGDTQEAKEWGNQTAAVKRVVQRLVSTHIDASPNAQEIYGLLCYYVGKADSEMTPYFYKKAVGILAEKLFTDVQSLHPVLFENKWATLGGSISGLYRNLSDAISSSDSRSYSLPKGDPAPTFYSHMAKVVDGVKQEKLGAASVVNMLRGKGVKAEEIKWSGIETFLEGKKSVTKAELQEFIAGSMLQIEEEMLTDKEIPYSQEHLDQIAKYEAERDIIAENLKSEWKRIVGTDIPITYFGAGLESAVVNNLLEANATKKGNTEAGYQYKAARAALQRCIEYNDFGFDTEKQAFREAVRNPKDFMKSYEMTSFEKGVFRDFIKAKEAYSKVEGISVEDQKALKAIAESADRYSNRINKVKSEHRAEAGKYLTKYRSYTIKGGSNYRELLFRIPGATYSNQAMDVHWERSGVLAHARIQDLNTFLGKMLFIEEIQSDWHNEGHKSGYTSDADLTRISELEDQVAQILTEKDKINQEYDAFLTRYWEEDLSEEEYRQYLSVRQERFTELSYKQRDLERELNELAVGNDVPDAPFKQNYHEYVLKRLLRMAAEQDYDSIGWTTADIQSDRWSDEFAEGYRIEYDQDIPKFLTKYGKKWGTTVGKTVLDNGTEVWSMAITDSMKDSVLYEGQVVYSLPKVEAITPTNEQVEQNIREIADMKPVHSVDASKLDKTGKRPSEIFTEHFDNWGWNIHSDELGDIEITPQSVRDEVRHGITAVKIASIEAIPPVIKQGKIIFAGQKPGTTVYRIVICAPITIGKNPYYMGVMLQRDANTQRLYLHNVVIEEETPTFSPADLLTTGANENNERLFITNILQAALNVKRQNQLDKEYMDAVTRGDMETAQRLVDQKAAEVGAKLIYDPDPDGFYVLKSNIPTKWVEAYKVFNMYDGEIYPLYIKNANKTPIPFRTWVGGKEGGRKYEALNGHAYVLGDTGQSHPRSAFSDEVWQQMVDDGVVKPNAKNSPKMLAYRPGWHGTSRPFFPQGGKKDDSSNYGKIHTANHVVCKVRFSKDIDLTQTAVDNAPLTKDGRPNMNEADLKYLPQENGKHGSYEYRTNRGIPPEVAKKSKWYVASAMYVESVLTQEEADSLLTKSGIPIQEWEGGSLDLTALGYSQDTVDANPKLRDAVTYDNDGNVIPLSERFNIDKNDVRYKLPIGEDTSPRALLANAFEGIVTNDIEKRRLQEYKGKVEMLNAEEQKLHELRAEIKELSFAKGKRDTKRIKDLQFDAIQTANRIATLDKMLLRLEAAAPLQSILQREKQMAYKRAEQKGKEALEAYRKAEKERDEQWRREVKDKYQASKKKAIETRDKREAREKLQQLVIDTVKWISYPSKTDVKCPDILKQPYADFLKSIDLSSQRLAKGGDPTKNDLRLANAMSSLATALDKVMTSQDPTQETTAVLDTGYLDLPANFIQKLRDMTEDVKAMMGDSEYVVNNMPAEEIRKLSQMIRTLNHAIKEVSTLYANLRFANVEALGDNTMSFIDALGEIEKTGGVKDFVQWDNALPYYAFKRFGEGGESIFEGLMDAQDKLAFLAQKIFDFQEKAWTGKEAKAWSEDTHTIDLPNGNTLTLTTADAMSIYCLSRRQQGLQHLLGGGTRVLGIQKGSQKAKDSRSILTIQDIDAIISSLTDRQKQVADAIQEFMSTVCSDWGNEISMKRFLTKEFNEKFYFPIESNDENLPTKDPSAQQSDLFRLLNISATKPIDPRANNEVIIRNIFDVFTNHASDMARLNAYGMPLLDYMKWLNYREKTVNEEGQINVRGVRKSMEKAFGTAARSYVLNLVKDVNGRPSDGGDPTILMKWMRTAKTASVGSSLRVATLQITSYPRAALVLSPKSLALGLSKLPNIDKAKKYCGIALWKSFGFYDTNISRSIEDQMKGVKDVKQKLIELSLKGAEWGDAITWGALWNACEYEVASTKKYKVGTEEFYQAVGKKLREVVYRTQVVDSTLTRSQIMRSKRGMAQEAAAFMSEPTVSANILMDAGFQFSAEKRKSGSVKIAWKMAGPYIAKAVAVYSIGQLAAALLEGLWDAWRDDEDEEFGEKYLNAFVENLALDLVPFNKIPIVSDVFEAVLAMFDVGFYSSDKMSTTWLTQAVSAVDAWKTVLSGESSTTAYNALYKTVRAISSFVGVSFSGVMREGVALWNNTAGAYDTTLKIRQYELSKADLGMELYEAIISGNTKQADSLKAKFEDPDSMSSAIRKALRENDSRIKEAAQAQINGDPSERVRIARQIVADGFAQDDVVRAINAEINAMTSSDSSTGTKEEAGLYTAADFAKEIANGDQAAANAAKVDIIQTAQKNGKSEEDAVKSFNSSAKTELKELFLAGEISEQEAINALTSYCDAEQDDAMADVQYWAFKQDYPDVYADDSWFDTYYEKVADSGISIDVYMEYRNKVSTITGENKKEKRMAVINSLPISSYQKDALYYAEGWAESKLYEAPWH